MKPLRSRALLTLLVLAAVLATAGGGLLLVQQRPALILPQAERLLSALLERELRVGEVERLELGADTFLQLKGLTIANPDWAPEPFLLSVEALSLRINLPSLWGDGPALLRELSAEGVAIDLRNPADREPNWYIPYLFEDDDEDGPWLSLLVGRAQVQDIQVNYRDGERDLHADIATAALERREPDTFLALRLEGALNQFPLSVQGAAGPEAALLSGRGLRLDLKLGLGELDLQARGEVADLERLTGADFELDVGAPRSRPLLELFGLGEMRDGPLKVTGRVRQAAEGIVLDLEGSLNEFELSARGGVGQPAALDDVDLTFRLAGPSAAEVGSLLGVAGLRALPFAASGRLLRDGELLQLENGELRAGEGRLTVAGRLPEFPGIQDWQADLNGSELDLSVLGAMLGLPGLPPVPASVNGTLRSRDDGVELVALALQSPKLDLRLEGVVGEEPGLRGTALTAAVSGAELSAFNAVLDSTRLPPEAFELSGNLAIDDSGWQLQDAHFVSPHLRATLSGSLDDPLEPRRVDGRLTLDSPDLAAALAAYGLPAAGLGPAPFQLSGALHRVQDGFDFSDLQGNLGALAFTGSGFLSDATDFAGSRLTLAAQAPSLATGLPFTALTGLPDQSAEAALEATYRPPLVEVPRLQLAVGGHRLTADLKVQQGADQPASASGRIALSGDTAETPLALISGQPDATYRLTAALQLDQARLAVEDIRAGIGRSDLSGRAALRFGEVPAVDANLRSATLYTELFPGAKAGDQQGTAPNAPSQRSGGARFFTVPSRAAMRDRMIPETPLDFAWLTGIDGRIRYRADRLILHEEQAVRLDVSLKADIEADKGILTARELNWARGALANGEARLSLDARGGANRFRLYLRTAGTPVLWLLAGTGEPPASPSSYLLELSGAGGTVREVAASLDGALLFGGEGALVSNAGLDLVMGDLLTSILDRLNPLQETREFTEIECHAGALQFDSGLLLLNPGIVTRTSDVDLFVNGALDLNDESLDLNFNSRARRGLGISASKLLTPYLKLAGNLSHPFLTVNPEGVVISGGAAVATGGLSLVAQSLWGRWVASAGNPCKRIIKQAEKVENSDFARLLREFRAAG